MVSQRTQWWGVCVALLLLVPFFALPAQTVGWEWLNPKPTGNSMYDVQMITEQFGVAVGENGGVIVTYDAGATWITRSTNTIAEFHAVHFHDSLNGVAGGSALTIVQTTDGGVTWQQRNQGQEYVEQVWDVAMLTPMHGVAVGGTNLKANILRTIDSGRTWSRIESPVENPLYAMHFINQQEGWAVGAWNTVIHTSDGGATWTARRSEGNGSGGGRRAEMKGVFFLDSLSGFMTSITGQFQDPGYLYSTTDGGYTWSSSIRNFGLRPSKTLFTTATTGYLLGSGIIYRTVDSGKQWSALYGADLPEITLFQGIGVNGSTIAAVGSPARIHSSNDTGSTWYVRSSGSAATFSGVSSTHSQQGIVVAVGRDGKANPDDQITIYSSTNGGAKWEKRPYPGQQILTNVACRDGLCIAVGDSGTILRSVDDGITWSECVSGVKNYLNDVVVINSRNAVAVGRNATVVRTTDGGETWTTQHQNSSYALFGVSFADSLTGLAVGNPPKLLGTTNGGATWDSIPTSSPSMLGVQMHDRLTATRRGVTEVARTTDGGKSWRPLPLPAEVVPFRMSFWNVRYGVVAPETGGTLYYTNDSGQTWSAEESGLSIVGTAFRMYGVSMIDSIRAIVAGPNGAILRFTKSLLSSSVVTENSQQQQLYCYPNPTTGITTVRLPTSEAGMIELFDALGRKIGADRWSQQSSSNGEVVVRLKGLPTGAYVIRIHTHNGINSVPVMLMP